MRSWKSSLLWLVAAISLATAPLVLFNFKSASAATGINPQLSFEGKVVKADGTNIADGTYNMEFKIYQDGTSSGSGSTLKWTEDYLVGGTPVTITNGTFQVNLGSLTAFGASVDWNQSVLWLSMQVGNTSSCTITTTFTSNCAGDGEMTPFIRLTATPYSLNSDKLDGLDSTVFGQLASSQTWTGADIIQPTANVTGLVVKQNSNGSPTADIFNIQTANSTSVIQITGPSANTAAVTISSIGGSSGLTLQSGSGTVSLGTSTTLNASGALTLSSGGTTQTLALSTPASTSASTGAITIQSGSASVGSNLSAGTITVDTGTRTGAGTATINIGVTNAVTLGIGNASSSTAITSTGWSVTGAGAFKAVSVDANTATTLNIGNTTATGVSLCNSAACDTITIGNNADADSITIGDSLDTTAINSTGWSITGAGALTLTSIKTTNLLVSSTAPTISSGFGTSPSISSSNGTAAFRINVGTGGAATSGVIGLPAATTGWNCFATDITTNSTGVFYTKQTASSTTTATIGNFSDVAVATAWTASNILAVSCFAY